MQQNLNEVLGSQTVQAQLRPATSTYHSLTAEVAEEWAAFSAAYCLVFSWKSPNTATVIKLATTITFSDYIIGASSYIQGTTAKKCQWTCEGKYLPLTNKSWFVQVFFNENLYGHFKYLPMEIGLNILLWHPITLHPSQILLHNLINWHDLNSSGKYIPIRNSTLYHHNIKM